MKSFLRKTIVVTLSIFVIGAIVQSGDKLLTLILTPLPKNIQNCLSEKFSSDVNAQAAVCTGITHTDSVAVWDTNGKIRESNVYEDYTNSRLGVGINAPLEKLHVDQGALSVNGGTTTTTGNVLLTSDATNGPYIAGNTNSSGNSTKTDGAMRVQVGNGFKVESSGTTIVTNLRTFTPRMTIDTTGNFTIGGSAIGDSRISMTGSNGDNDSMLTMKQPSGSVFSILPFSNLVYLSAGIYYNNGTWTHANVAGNSNNQLLRMNPGTGVEWLASNNSLPSWNQTGGVAQLLWDDVGRWNAPLKYTNVTVDGESSNVIKQASSSTLTGTHYYVNDSTSVGYVHGTTANFGLLNSAGTAFGLYVPVGTSNAASAGSITAGTDVVATSNVYSKTGIYYAGTSNRIAVQGSTVDSFLRLNPSSDFTSGVWTPGALWTASTFRADGVTTFNNNVNINTGKTLTIDSVAGAPIQISTSGSSTGLPYTMSTVGGGAGVDSADVENYLQTAAGNFRWYVKTGGTKTLKMTLASNGNLTITGAYNPSDIRLKKDIVRTEGALNKLDKIDGVEFTWKEDNRKGVGFIAQTVEKVFPLLVSTDEKGIKSIAYANMNAYIVEAIKELHAIVNKLVERVTTIETKQTQQEEIIKKQQETIETQQQQITDMGKRLEKLEHH